MLHDIITLHLREYKGSCYFQYADKDLQDYAENADLSAGLDCWINDFNRTADTVQTPDDLRWTVTGNPDHCSLAVITMVADPVTDLLTVLSINCICFNY